ncbi:hypothetical protein [Streptosporangium canum]|uniref:hypothetical protein n=1 Tax=Streptosporangium canum TaxID=324952 RepID=UPI00378D4572
MTTSTPSAGADTPASPLFTRQAPLLEYTDLAAHLAATADAATVRTLLTISRQPAADRIAAALDERTDLPVEALALLVAVRPGLRSATTRLKEHLFPAGRGCHRFTRAIAALAHRPESLELDFTADERFAEAAAEADPGAVLGVLTDALAAPRLDLRREEGLRALTVARAARGHISDPLAHAARQVLERTRLAALTDPLLRRRAALLEDLSRHTGGLTRALQVWFDDLVAGVGTPEQARAASEYLDRACAHLAAAHHGDHHGDHAALPGQRWQQVTATARAARTARAHHERWRQAWHDTLITADGSRWADVQRPLVTAYNLLTVHAREVCGDLPAPPTPAQCWASDPSGRQLLHLAADHLTGCDGQRPLEHFDDALLIAFTRALTKNHRDKIPAALHIHAMIAAVKAARSKAFINDATADPRIGLVIPMRDEAGRISAPSLQAPDGHDAIGVKLAQLAWLFDARPGARAHVLLVDEAPDAASARAARAVLETAPAHPQIHISVATHPARIGDSAKGGAVLWGLARLLNDGWPILAYTDLDLTYPLDQLGLLLHRLDQPGVGAVIGSRRTGDAYGYYPPAGPTPTATLYRQAACELLGLEVGDPQAGFKAFSAPFLRAVLPQVHDRQLSFDTELLALVQRAGGSITETGVCSLHRYTEGLAAPRDYDAMLAAVHAQATRHGLDPATRATPVYDRIRKAGSLHAAAQSATPATPLLPLSPAPK